MPIPFLKSQCSITMIQGGVNHILVLNHEIDQAVTLTSVLANHQGRDIMATLPETLWGSKG